MLTKKIQYWNQSYSLSDWKLLKKGGSRKYQNQNHVVCRSSVASNGNCWPEHSSGTDVIIVGAGVAGAALAHTLGKDGRRVHVIERELTELDRIVGELLQPGGYLNLVELGLEDCLEGIDAHRVNGYALFKREKRAILSYPLKKSQGDVAGRSFHNGRFVQRMREKAATLPNVQLDQGTVTSLLEENGTVKGVQYKTKDGQELQAHAPLTFVCDGGFSNLRRSLCKGKVDITSYSVALVLENCKLPFENHGHFLIGDSSLISLFRIGSNEIRCLIDVQGRKIPSIANGDMANFLKTVVVTEIFPELRDALISAVEKGNIRTIPNRYLPPDPRITPGAVLLGDAFDIRHPITGGGMTVALSDVVLLRDLLRPSHNLHDNTAFLNSYLESFYTLRKPVSSSINTLAESMHRIYSPSHDQVRKALCQIVYDYATLGGFFTSGLVSVLSGLNPSPSTLMFHFIISSCYGFGRLLLPFPSPNRFWFAAKFLMCAANTLYPVVKEQGVRQTYFPFTVPAVCRLPQVYKTKYENEQITEHDE